MKNKITKYVFLFALFLGILTPTLFTDGMFMDGAIYASISKKLANGLGSFWNLHFTNTLFPVFNEHPPLALYLSSLSFKLFGDSILSERLYSLLTGIFAIILIIFIKKEFSNTKTGSYIIIAPLIFILFPGTIWAYSNNMLENTMTVFVLLSALFSLISLRNKRILMLFISGIFLFAGFLSKGLPAFFIWAIFFFHWLIYKRNSFLRTVVDTSLLILFTLLPLILIFFFNETAHESLINYFNKQVIASLENVKTVDTRFYILKALFNEMILSIGVIVLIVIIIKVKKIKNNINKVYLNNSIFFILIALSGVVPIMISMKQRSFYILPALPFVAISVSYIFDNLLEAFPNVINFFKRRFWVYLSYSLLGISLIMIGIFYGKPGRDKDVLHDIYLMKNEVPKNETISICKGMYNYWSLHAYLQRYCDISMTDKEVNKYFLSESNCISNTTYKKVNLGLKTYTLYKISK